MAPVTLVQLIVYSPSYCVVVGPVGADGAAGVATVTLLVPESELVPALLAARTRYCQVPAPLPVRALLVSDPS